MSNLWDARFDRLHDCQTRQLGVDIRATVGSVITNARALLGIVRNDDVPVEGGIGERGGYEIQVKASDVAEGVTKDLQCTINGAADGKTLVLTSFEHRGGVYLLNIGDPDY